ncbi:MAG: calcium/sodium antiporter [Nocardioidaceae bacterium]
MTTAVLVVGVCCAVVGGDLFVRGVVSLAAWWRVPAGIIGATVAAFATSSPELSVAVASALRGRPEIALGDALGSNIVNIAVVLGLALASGAIVVEGGALGRDIPMAVAAPAVLGLLGLDGTIGRLDATILLLIFLGWLTRSVLAARTARESVVAVLQERTHRTILVSVVVGLGLLIVSGRLIVTGAVGVSQALGWDGFVVGAVFVALGTSTPEIATMVAARVRGHEEVGVGTVLGSNIFNTLLVVAVATLISPIEIDRAEFAVGIMVSIVVVVLAIPGGSGRLGRWRSLPLLATYAAMVVLLVDAAHP